MRSMMSILMLICLVSAINFQPSHSSQQQQPSLNLRTLIQKGLGGPEEPHGQRAVGTDVASSRLGLGLKFKAILLKPLLLVVLAKIKLALLLGKPLALLALKKLLLKAVLGKLLLKIPLILLGGKALLAKVLALKFALITKGLIGLKAPLALLFLGGLLKGALKGTGLGLALGLAGSLLKPSGQSSSGEEYDEPAYYAPPAYGHILPPPPPSYGAPAPYSQPIYLRAPAAPSYTPVHSAPAHQSYAQGGSPNVYLSNEHNGYGGYDGGRKKRNVEEGNDSEEEVEDSEEDFSDESPEELRREIEAARTNGHAYLYMAAQFDEQSCGRRLMCEVYQKPQGSRTDDELILQDIFGYPLPPLSEEDQGTPKEMYYRAAQLGASNQGRPNNQICARVYASCPHNSEQLISFFINEDEETNEIDTDNNRPISHLQPPQQSAVRLPFYHPRQPINISPAQQWKPVIVRPAVHRQQPQAQVWRPTVAATPVAPLRKRILASPAA